MFASVFDWRKVAAAGLSMLIAACSIVPKTQAPPPPPPATSPSSDVLPTDLTRHRVALLVPLTGENAAVGQSIANAATMALLDTNADSLRVTTYDTGPGAGEAAKRAVHDGNKLILGPLLSSDIPAVLNSERGLGIPLISFSNDATAASGSVFIMGNLPSQSISQTVGYAKANGISTFAALIPRGEYGQRASDALMESTRAKGATVQAIEPYDRSASSISAAARRLQARGGFDAVLIADGGRMASIAAPILKPEGGTLPRILGTELWSGDKIITTTPSLDGAWFSAVSDARFGQFSQSYRRRFGATPYRIATLGYDAVLLTLRIAREWKQGGPFPTRLLTDSQGFLGLDGPFRFTRGGVIERALEVREVRGGTIVAVKPARARFSD